MFDLRDALAGLPPGHPSTWNAQQARVGIPALVALENQVVAWKLQAVAAFDAAGGAQTEGFRTTGDWLQKRARVADGGATVHTARDLRDVLPATAAALAEGSISAEHVRAIRRGRRMFGADFQKVETTVVDYATRRTPRELRIMIDRMIQQYCPDGSEDEAEVRRQKRKVFLSQSLGGWWHLTGLLDPVTGEKLNTALQSLEGCVGPDDQRSPGARRADALAELAERAMDTTDRPTGYGHLTLVLTPEQARTGLDVRWPSGALASRTDVAVQTCSAEVTYVVGIPTDDVHWQPLDVGFAHRYATPAQRRALAVRDGSGCAHPGCTVPGWRCVAHHIRPWNEGGPSDLSNLVLLCRFHHRETHRGRLRITFQGGRATAEVGMRAPP